jgi:DNA-binding transcriptional MocR family regulator
MWCLVESAVNGMQVHIDPFAQSTISRYLTLSSSPLQLAVMGEVYVNRALEQGVAFVPGAPFYAADADAATLRPSFAKADVGKILEGVGRLGRAI